MKARTAEDLARSNPVGLAAMPWFRSLWSRLASISQWREIATAPFDRELELAVMDGGVGVLDFSYIRHGDGWLDAETLKPVDIAATHWRFRRPTILPMSCC